MRTVYCGAIGALAIASTIVTWRAATPNERVSSPLVAQDETSMTSSPDAGSDLHVAFDEALRKIEELRKANRSTAVECAYLFGEFHRYDQTTPYVSFFKTKGISAITVDMNQRHYVYWEINYQQLRSMGFGGFLRGDRLVIGFTTTSTSSTEITSFRATLLNSNQL
jgi:hypothetical protein